MSLINNLISNQLNICGTQLEWKKKLIILIILNVVIITEPFILISTFTHKSLAAVVHKVTYIPLLNFKTPGGVFLGDFSSNFL
jgi:hypothetical protein